MKKGFTGTEPQLIMPRTSGSSATESLTNENYDHEQFTVHSLRLGGIKIYLCSTISQETQWGPGSDIKVSRKSFTFTYIAIKLVITYKVISFAKKTHNNI